MADLVDKIDHMIMQGFRSACDWAWNEFGWTPKQIRRVLVWIPFASACFCMGLRPMGYFFILFGSIISLIMEYFLLLDRSTMIYDSGPVNTRFFLFVILGLLYVIEFTRGEALIAAAVLVMWIGETAYNYIKYLPPPAGPRKRREAKLTGREVFSG